MADGNGSLGDDQLADLGAAAWVIPTCPSNISTRPPSGGHELMGTPWGSGATPKDTNTKDFLLHLQNWTTPKKKTPQNLDCYVLKNK